jgi:hypothetical protein
VADGRALEPSRLERLFQLAQMAHDGGLAEMERASGPPQAAGLSHGEEHAQIVPLHAGSVATSLTADALPIRSGVIEI